jgi:replicative DNA helicase
MLLDKEAISKVIELLEPESFYRDANRRIFEAMTSLFDRSEPVDLVTLTEELRRRGELDQIGGPVYLAELSSSVATSANVEFHGKIILEKAIMRSLIGTSTEIASRAYNETEDALDLLDEAEQKIFKISEARMKKSYRSIKDVVSQAIEMLESIHGKHSGVTGVPSGFSALDNITAGFQKSDLIIVAGRPSQGKTAIVLNIARNAAVKYGIPVAIFSLEMAEMQLAFRLICAEVMVDSQRVRTGTMSDSEWKRISRGVGRLAESKIFIDDTPSLGILELRAKARRLKAEHDIGLVIVDYLQLMQGPRNAENREREISAISRSLKAISKELSIPVVALSQLSRAVEARTGRRPVLSDLRESGAIEQDADVVLFIHRPETYNEKFLFDNETPSEGMAELIVGKQRNGPAGQTIVMKFLKDYAKFETLDTFHEEEPVPPRREAIESELGEEGPPF